MLEPLFNRTQLIVLFLQPFTPILLWVYYTKRRYLPEIFQEQSFADVLQNSCSKKISYVSKKKPVLESLFDKVAGLKACSLIKKRLQHSYFPVKFATFLKTFFFFYRKPQAAASQPAFTYSKLTIETLEQGVKYVKTTASLWYLYC